jgi:DNA polymerase-3 subunit gamma/tau
MSGDIKAALDELRSQYDVGADPAVVLQDMLELTHWITRVKIVPEAGNDVTVAEMERTRGRAMAERLGMPVLARTWQMLLKGLNEARLAPSPLVAAEMVLVRLAYAADLPSPAEAVKQIVRGESGPVGASSATDSPASAPATPQAMAHSAPQSSGAPQAALATAPHADFQADAEPDMPPVDAEAAPAPATSLAEPGPLADFRAVVDFVHDKGEPLLAASLASDVHLVRFAPGRIELRLGERAERKLPSRLAEDLTNWTGERWMVSVSGEPGEPTIAEQDEAAEAAKMAAVEAHPMVRAVREAFPGAKIVRTYDREPAPTPSEGDAGEIPQDPPTGDGYR